MLDIKDSLGTKWHLAPDGRRRRLYIFKCIYCETKIAVRRRALKTCMGMCFPCSVEYRAKNQRRRPYEALYNIMVSSCINRKIKNSITYDEFLIFTKTTFCHYCDLPVTWAMYDCSSNGNNYNLDRKDNAVGYTVENCVVCCKSCNKTKWTSLDYEEMIAVGKIRKRKREEAKKKQRLIGTASSVAIPSLGKATHPFPTMP